MIRVSDACAWVQQANTVITVALTSGTFCTVPGRLFPYNFPMFPPYFWGNARGIGAP